MARGYTLDIDDWNEGTRDLTLEQQGAYLRLVNAIRKSERALPLDYRKIAAILGVSQRRARTLLADLHKAGKLYIEGNTVHNPRSMRDLAEDARLASGGQSARKPSRRQSNFHNEKNKPHKSLKSKGAEVQSPNSAATAGRAPPSAMPRIMEALGLDPADPVTPAGRSLGGPYNEHEVRYWQDELGLSPSQIVAVVRDVMGRKPDGEPPSSLRYFRGSIERLAKSGADAQKKAQGADKGGKNGAARPVGPEPRCAADLTAFQRSQIEQGEHVVLGGRMVRAGSAEHERWRAALRGGD